MVPALVDKTVSAMSANQVRGVQVLGLMDSKPKARGKANTPAQHSVAYAQKYWGASGAFFAMMALMA